MTFPCGCCGGIEVVNPLRTDNRPGLDALSFRIGTYASFLQTMLARLSSPDFRVNAENEDSPISGAASAGNQQATDTPLRNLKTRDSSDPAIALIDAWSVLADILTFYQERIANEGYLRSAVERRSVLELARLVGYELRPGVASSVYLAYTLDKDSEVTIPAGSRVQSLPSQGELPQSFETSSPLLARGVWSNLVPRLNRPQVLTADATDIYLDGVGLNLKQNDPLLLIASPGRFKRISAVDTDFANKRTKVSLQQDNAIPSPNSNKSEKADLDNTNNPDIESGPAGLIATVPGAVSLVHNLLLAPAAHPRSPEQLGRSVSQTFSSTSDISPALIKTFYPEADKTLDMALKNATVTPKISAEVHAFRVQASPFGHNAPLKPITDGKGVVIGSEEWPLEEALSISIEIPIAAEKFVGTDFRAEHFLMAFVAHTASTVEIKQGATSAKVQVAIPGSAKVGRWRVEATTAKDRGLLFQVPELKLEYSITVDQTQHQLNVSVNREGPVSVAAGQSVSAPVGVHQLTVGYSKVITVADDIGSASTHPDVVLLDSAYDQIVKGSWVAIERPDKKGFPQIFTVKGVQKLSVAKYGMTARVTQLTLDRQWLDREDVMLTTLRNATVFAQSEELNLSEAPVSEVVEGDHIELADLYSDLQSGRWLIVQGERADIPNTDGVKSAELVMLGGVEQGVQQLTMNASSESSTGMESMAQVEPLPGDFTHSFLRLANPLSYQYKRHTVTIYGNVVNATHGESRKETLGGGDSSQALQQFSLHQSPVTYVAATTPQGAQSTLEVRVNDLLWHEVDTLADANAKERCYVTQTSDDDKLTIMFGDGKHGMRPPSGMENISASYRIGIGSGGNAAAGKISILATRPLGVRSVINPLAATGGANKDTRDQARRNTPIAAVALDRLVSVQDYADFARSFAGIGKAGSSRLSDGTKETIFVTIAGAEDIAIAQDSDLIHMLLQAFREFGESNIPVTIMTRELMLLVISAGLKVLPDYQFDSVARAIRAALLDGFSFSRSELGRSVFLSEAIAAIQGVAGVEYVDVNVFESVRETETQNAKQFAAALNRIAKSTIPKRVISVQSAGMRSSQIVPAGEGASGVSSPAEASLIRAAQLAYLTPKLPDTLILTEITS